MTTFTREIKTIQKFELIEGKDSIKIIYEDLVYFLSKKEWIKNLIETPDPFKSLEKCKRYHIQSPQWWSIIQTEGVAQRLGELRPVDYSLHNDWVEKENQMVHFNYIDHLLYGLDGDLFPRAYLEDFYLRSSDFDLKIAQNILKKLQETGFVISYEVKEVPYYNKDVMGSQYIKFYWKMEKKEYNEHWNSILNGGGKYPSTLLKELYKLPQYGLEDARIIKKIKRNSK